MVALEVHRPIADCGLRIPRQPTTGRSPVPVTRTAPATGSRILLQSAIRNGAVARPARFYGRGQTRSDQERTDKQERARGSSGEAGEEVGKVPEVPVALASFPVRGAVLSVRLSYRT